VSEPTEAPDWTHFLRLDDDALLAQCELDRFRASGPGGQKRNKTDSAVRLRHRPSGVTGEAVESRSQHQNRARALRRLRLAIALDARLILEDPATPPADELAEALRLGKLRAIRMGARDARYPATVAAVLDRLAAAGWQVAEAAAALGITTSALGRFLESDPVVWRAVQRQRQAAGLSPLRSSR
jgi:hypothetical protein